MRKRYSYKRYKRAKVTRLKDNSSYKQWLKDHGSLKCWVCGWHDPTIQPFYMIEIHHIRRVADGGTGNVENLLPCCPNHHNLADRISCKNKNINISKDLMISLIKQHEFDRDQHISKHNRFKNESKG